MKILYFWRYFIFQISDERDELVEVSKMLNFKDHFKLYLFIISCSQSSANVMAASLAGPPASATHCTKLRHLSSNSAIFSLQKDNDATNSFSVLSKEGDLLTSLLIRPFEKFCSNIL